MIFNGCPTLTLIRNELLDYRLVHNESCHYALKAYCVLKLNEKDLIKN